MGTEGRTRSLRWAAVSAIRRPQQRSAAQFLCAIGPESLSACDKLRKRLSDTHPKVKLYAAGALYEICREIKQPLDVCVRMLQHEDPEIRIIASSVLGGMYEDAQKALPALEFLLKDPDESVRMWAERHIEQIRKGR